MKKEYIFDYKEISVSGDGVLQEQAEGQIFFKEHSFFEAQKKAHQKLSPRKGHFYQWKPSGYKVKKIPKPFINLNVKERQLYGKTRNNRKLA